MKDFLPMLILVLTLVDYNNGDCDSAILAEFCPGENFAKIGSLSSVDCGPWNIEHVEDISVYKPNMHLLHANAYECLCSKRTIETSHFFWGEL